MSERATASSEQKLSARILNMETTTNSPMAGHYILGQITALDEAKTDLAVSRFSSPSVPTLQAGPFIRLGNGQGWPVALQPAVFYAGDGEVVSFETGLDTIPHVEFDIKTLAPLRGPLNRGLAYDIRAEDLTAKGFTVRADVSMDGERVRSAMPSGERIRVTVTPKSS